MQHQKGPKRIKRIKKDQKKDQKERKDQKDQKGGKDQKDQKDQKDPAVHGPERIKKDQPHPPSVTWLSLRKRTLEDTPSSLSGSAHKRRFGNPFPELGLEKALVLAQFLAGSRRVPGRFSNPKTRLVGFQKPMMKIGFEN